MERQLPAQKRPFTVDADVRGFQNVIRLPAFRVKALHKLRKQYSGIFRMPLRKTPHKPGTRKYLQNCSYELQCACWFSQAGWQVFTPLFDHGHKTDLLISDGENSYRIQVKTAENASDAFEITNLWNGSRVDYVALFAKNSSWGTIFAAFSEKSRKLKHVDGFKFKLTKASFMKAFHSLP